MKLLYEDLTKDIIGAYYTVYNALRQHPHYDECNYSHALAIELASRNHVVEQQVLVRRLYRGQPVGVDYLDLVVDGKVVLEIKKAARFAPAHEDQARTYLRDSGLAVGLLLYFGREAPIIKRLFEPGNVQPGEA